MRSTAAVAILFALVAHGADAQVTGVVTESTARVQFRAGATSTYSGDNIAGTLGSTAFGSGASFESTSRVDPDSVAFKNGNATGGDFAYATSRTVVDISFRNDGATTVRPSLSSDIVPAGMGFFVAPDCLNDVTQCGDGGPVRPFNFDNLSPSETSPLDNRLAGANFIFRITAMGVAVYELKGSLLLLDDPVTGARTVRQDIDAASAALDGFAATSDPGSRTALGYAWDTTALMVDFPDGTLLAPGESATLTYETIVESFSRTSCFTLLTNDCLTAYSSFGDPVGRGGGTNPQLAFGAAAAASAVDIDGLSFDSFRFQYPEFRDGVLYFKLLDGAAPVPEPTSIGLLFAGGVLMLLRARRSRRPRA